jgi:ABC-type sugar transport system permease subunit
MSLPERRGGLVPLCLVAPSFLLLALFFAGPLVLLVRVSLFAPAAGRGCYQPGTWTAGNYAALAGDPYFREVFTFTLLLALGVTSLVLLLAYPLALFVHGLAPRRQALALAAVVLPKLASMLVGVYGLQALLSGAGPVNRLLIALGLAGEPVFEDLLGSRLTHVDESQALPMAVQDLGRAEERRAGGGRSLGEPLTAADLRGNQVAVRRAHGRPPLRRAAVAAAAR